MALNYNAPDITSPDTSRKSSIDQGGNRDQMQSFFWLKKGLIEARDEMHFSPLADVTTMPKHHGKEIRLDHYIPVLDDRNINDQGIDASGATIVNGNLYGSSRDVGNISSKMPDLTENGGRVNRIGFTRLKLQGSFSQFGFFYEWTEDSMQFDSDAQLDDHLSREAMTAAVKIQEDQLQIDLLDSARTVIYAGAAGGKAGLSGETGAVTAVSYADFVKLDQMLTEKKAPRKTTIISGSSYTDTRVIPSARIMFVGPELVPQLRKLTDSFGNPAFIPVQQYAAAGSLLNGEVGTIFNFRIIEVPTMMYEAGESGAVGATVTNNEGYRTTGSNYNAYPMLVVSDKSFTTIGFNNNGKSLGVNVKTRMPGSLLNRDEPYGVMGLCSMRWWYGFLAFRPERIGCIWTVAEE